MTAWVRGGLPPPGGQGSNVYVRNITFPSGCPAGRIGDRGDREIAYVEDAYVPFLAPRFRYRNTPCASETFAKSFADFRASISRKSGHKKFHEKSSTNSTSRDTNFFHGERLWEGAWGHNILLGFTDISFLVIVQKRPFVHNSVRTFWRVCSQLGGVFAILFEVLLIENQEEIHHFAGLRARSCH